MDGPALVPDDVLDPPPPPPPRLFERLRQIAGYTWDESAPPFHSTYDFWHVFGTRYVYPNLPTSASSQNASSPGSVSKLQLGRPTPSDHGGPLSSYSYGYSSEPPASPLPAANSNPLASPSTDSTYIEEPVVARVSHHALREERAFQIAKSVSTTADPNGDHIVKPLDLIRLNPVAGDRGAIVVAIYQHPGPNHLLDLLDMGPAFYHARKDGDAYRAYHCRPTLHPPISLRMFLDFAIGATQCLEILHHSRGMVHGEIRGDAFHFNAEENKVRVMSFGSGVRSFEHGLTSTGWSMLSKELGGRNKLLYISPEQTGRMPAEPDTRTDIYSLGVLFWTLLTQQPVYAGETALDIVQGVLGRRIPNVATVRMDIPDVIGRIIQKCTAKNVTDRYHSASGLRHDLINVQEYLEDGNLKALKEFRIGTSDVSSFFMLPTSMIGRQEEKAAVLKVINRVAKSHAAQRNGPASRFSDGASLNEVMASDDISSEGGASSADGNNRRSGSFAQTISSETRQTKSSPFPTMISETMALSTDTTSSSQSAAAVFPRFTRPWERWERHQSVSLGSLDSSSMVESLNVEGPRGPLDIGASSLSRHLGSAKFRRHGHCEVIMVEGTGGVGKSLFLQSVLADARRNGYCATAKFDTAKRTPFGPLLKLLSSLFKQVWGERNTDTQFHQGLKHYIHPVWPFLHRVLGLPEFLLGSPDMSVARPISSSQSSGSRKDIRPPLKRRTSSPGEESPGPLPRSVAGYASQSSQDYLRAGASTKTMRLINTILDVLRVFTTHKFICFCLEDLHFADGESLELISQIIAARMKMVVIVTYRPEELSLVKLQAVLQPPESDGDYDTLPRLPPDADTVADYPRSARPQATRIVLSPLSEDDILQYVSTTLCRPQEEILSLALVIQSKTAGNPFYMREMLSACHRKRCIWYDYRDSQWHYDMDRLFAQFQGEKDYDVLDTAFITHRLGELPSAARAVLAWAALLGGSFSFELLCRLMSGEFDYPDDEAVACQSHVTQHAYSEGEAIAGLQAAIQAYIIVQTESDDRFRFAHDRYVQASSALKECNARKMHFIISQTLLKYYAVEARQRDSTASHICTAVEIIKRRVRCRREFRKLLMECAQAATENGARPTAAKYYSAAVVLLQDDPWSDGVEDASYDETIQLYLRSAECHLYMGQMASADELLSTIFTNAKGPVDKAPAYVLQSRMYSQGGNSLAALVSLKESLALLGVPLDEEATFEKCDEKFLKIAEQIQGMDRQAILGHKKSSDPSIPSIGAVLAETTNAAWWSDRLQFFHLSLLMFDIHHSLGSFPQSGMVFLNLSVIALARFNMVPFAIDLSIISQDLLFQARDAYSLARGEMLHQCFIGHVHCSMPLAISQMEDAIELASVAGDRISTIHSYGLAAQVKFFASENCTELETFCELACEEIFRWACDTRGGVMLIAVRQACRALQGKTSTHDALEVLTDGEHSNAAYKNWLVERAQGSNRPMLFYESFEIVVLFLFGHYDRAIEIGEVCFEQLADLWSARNTRMIIFFYGLALTGRLLRRIQDPRSQPGDFSADTAQVLEKLGVFLGMINDWATVCDVNYLPWARLLQAQMAELSNRHGESIRHYEEALDHAAEHDFVMEEALGNYLMAGFFIRRKARRSARAALLDALSLYRQVAATGVAHAIEEEHSLLLHGPTRNHRVADTGVQTDFVTDAPSVQYRPVDGEDDDVLTQIPSNTLTESKGEQIGAWRNSMHMQTEDGGGLPALDMIDLHAILKSSQVISSLLQVEELLKTMCDVILQTCGGSATNAAIVVDADSDGWCVAASGDPENGASAHKPALPLASTPLIAENVVLYCTRFMESVFIPDIVSDERFGNVSESWLQRNPTSKAIIAIPIRHANKPLLGVLYLEGVPGSFTDRNVTVLQLLVNQIGISYSNALSIKNIEKISAQNHSMVEVQRNALKKAYEAEAKAKNAEAEAKRNVKLAEEAAKAKSIFLANVSHELRTPLNGVIGNSELLRDSNLNRDQLEMADSIRVSADLLLTVINDILDFSKMEADKMKLYIIAFNPEEMVREVVRAVSYSNREKTSKKNVKIIQDINLPSMLIYGDPIRLHQVLGNLIGNSLKFTEDGSITIGARLDEETKERATLTFWVRDTGIGIPPQQLAKLFQPFSQADASTARKYGGSGLGLSICKSLIEIMMQGKIQLESEPNLGTTAWFTVSFEKAKPDVAAGDAQSQTSPPVDRYSARTASFVERAASPNPYLDLTRVPKEDIRICVAEDNPINQKIAIQYVQRLGYTSVSAYENGQKAVEGLRQKAREGIPYHIVLMDVQMPVLDGYEATKLIRIDPIDEVRKILVIAMTASAIQGDREKCLAAGMNDYLAKPVRAEVLKRKLDAYMSNSRPSPPSSTPSPPNALTYPDTTNGYREAMSSVPKLPPPPRKPLPPSNASSTSPEPFIQKPVPIRSGSGSLHESLFDGPRHSEQLHHPESPIFDVEELETPFGDDSVASQEGTKSRSTSRTSSDQEYSDSAARRGSASQGQKHHQPRKLTKSRGNGTAEVKMKNGTQEEPIDGEL
ncbi:serine threonine kinase [Trichoderma cornu-damae]|uniref:histidine kinase n=1 Tax=Trichoderma cornu-damae TaxID=654480 RepID=A0A9P8QQ25_9HYPO|nr:serine threonine kinase [Trichoderma cornu-damae]